ncbi:MAG: cytochrome P450, partial [Alphaproteobacteria bacterium]
MSSIAVAPANVPGDRVVDVDVYASPPAGMDFLMCWKVVQDASPASLIWTPRNEGHWIATRGKEIASIYQD